MTSENSERATNHDSKSEGRTDHRETDGANEIADQQQQLHAYQSQLLDILHNSNDPQTAATQIQDLMQQSLQINSESLDQRMVDVAIQLTKKWGVRKSDTSSLD